MPPLQPQASEIRKTETCPEYAIIKLTLTKLQDVGFLIRNATFCDIKFWKIDNAECCQLRITYFRFQIINRILLISHSHQLLLNYLEKVLNQTLNPLKWFLSESCSNNWLKSFSKNVTAQMKSE